MSWVILVLAGFLEIVWAVGLKYTGGFTRPWPTLWTVLAMIASFWLLGVAMKTLPVGTAYTVWVGVGSVGTVVSFCSESLQTRPGWSASASSSPV